MNWRNSLFFLCTIALFLAFAARARATPFATESDDWEGTHDFVQLAKELFGDRVIVTSEIDFKDLKREDGFVLIHPERSLDVTSFAAFMRMGGRVLLLDDYGTGDALLQHFGIRRVPAPRHPALALRKNPQFALAEPASGHPVVRDVARVVTNHPTGLLHPELSPVLRIRGEGEPDVLFAEAGAVDKGRFLAVGDASIVINTMLRYPGNKEFALAMLKYALDDDTWGRRNGRLFIAVGAFSQTGSLGDSSADEEWNTLRRNIQDALLSLRREGMPPMMAYTLAILFGLGILAWVAARATRGARQTIPRYARPIPVAVHGGVAGHAAALSASDTPRTLAFLELKSALEEDLSGLLGLDHTPTEEVLFEKVKENGLCDGEGLRLLRQLLLRMANVQGGAMVRIRERDVTQAAAEVQTILRMAHERAGKRDGDVLFAERQLRGDA